MHWVRIWRDPFGISFEMRGFLKKPIRVFSNVSEVGEMDTVDGFLTWQSNQANSPGAPWLAAAENRPFDDRIERGRIAAKVDISPASLTDTDVDHLIAFLGALTRTASIIGQLCQPDPVPGGLEVQE